MMHSVTDINSFTHLNDAVGAVVVCRNHCKHCVDQNEAHTVNCERSWQNWRIGEVASTTMVQVVTQMLQIVFYMLPSSLPTDFVHN